MAGNVVTLRWDQPGNKSGGGTALEVQPSGSTMTGGWTYDPRLYDSGLRGGGRWTFQRR